MPWLFRLFLLLLMLPALQAQSLSPAAERVLALLNRERVQQGLQALRPQAQLQAAAQAHADYLALHQQTSHSQERDRELFLGERPADRARALGYAERRRGVVAEVFVVGHEEPEAAIQHLLSGPYHRHVLLSATAEEAGVGVNAQPGLVIALGSPGLGWREPVGPPILLWPGPDAHHVPPEACCEQPRPANLDRFGMPVSIQALPGERLSVQAFELEDEAGQRVDTVLLQGPADPHLRLAPHVAYLLPRQPLQALSRYRVRATFSTGWRQMQREWQFHTGER
ncbi:hypothetical protein HNQ51_000366 [Inhella inkyongensis]|uniref:SCP domain-containing protein n=1 Tax=Inhella inkyongensis TaxID=392593 RepID=A0A840RZU6_9BURK|nr:CAP domain-containing protein [Inhella inkyongensis]MBB5203073.1 hypothetical protein [Inhella inkyongensis]